MLKYYNDIPVGRENAATKKQLMTRWNMSERQVRKIISELRAEDQGDTFVIVSSSTNGTAGYYKTTNLDEIKKYERETLNRGKHTFRPLRKIRKVYERILENDC